MQLLGHEALLVLRCDRNGHHRVRLCPTQDEALKEWTATSRVSPIYPCEIGGASAPTSHEFRNTNHLVLLGPVDPQRVLPEVKPKADVWLSLGLFNLVVRTDKRGAERLLDFARSNSVPFERWTIRDGQIDNCDAWDVPTIAATTGFVAKVTAPRFPPELKHAVSEYSPLMATTLARSASLPGEVQSELADISDKLAELICSWSNTSTNGNRYVALGQLLTINASLSRFSSQTYAGTTPIDRTECHFWSHSLLGIATASIALRNIRYFLQRHIGEARIPERIVALSKITSKVPDHTSNVPFDDYLGSVSDDQLGGDQLVPLLTYFSARDGFRSTELSISAPLATISAADTPEWSLTTITHEVSHVVVRSVQAELLPDLDSLSELKECTELVRANRPAPNVFLELRRWMLEAVIRLSTPLREKTHITEERLAESIQRTRHDMDEIMVHVFDLHYFYGGKVDRYLESIWVSWGAIPNVKNRIPDYLVRSICAVLSKHLDRPDNATIARDVVSACLGKLATEEHATHYAHTALKLLEHDWEKIADQVRARRSLVRFAATVLFSPRIATQVRAEPKRRGDSGKNEGYPHSRMSLDIPVISNPLTFVEAYTQRRGTPASSVWLFHVLAFGYRDD